MTKRISVLGPGGLTRRGAVCIGAAAGIAALAAVGPARAVLSHPILANIQPISIALPDFLASSPAEAELAASISTIITANLKRGGLFAPIDQATFIEKFRNVDVVP
jgi:TolB protein